MRLAVPRPPLGQCCSLPSSLVWCCSSGLSHCGWSCFYPLPLGDVSSILRVVLFYPLLLWVVLSPPSLLLVVLLFSLSSCGCCCRSPLPSGWCCCLPSIFCVVKGEEGRRAAGRCCLHFFRVLVLSSSPFRVVLLSFLSSSSFGLVLFLPISSFGLVLLSLSPRG